MKRPRTSCAQIEADLIATATGDADDVARRRVHEHAGWCASCGSELDRYRVIDRTLGVWRAGPEPAAGLARARTRLDARLGELRRRTVAYRIFPSPLGNILIGLSEHGVSIIEYLDRAHGLAHSRLARLPGVEAVEDGAEVERYYRELLEYLEGRRTQLEWPLDLKLARSDFHRQVLRATAGIPHGAVTSYAAVAGEIGRPSATRAVAQALRWNPIPIVIPCHRVVGASGALTGYAGDRVGLKQRLLAVEGVAIVKSHGDLKVPRQSMYVRYPGDDSYCLPTCSALETVDHPHRLMLFGSRDRAEAAGLHPCDACRPDLHPLPARGGP